MKNIHVLPTPQPSRLHVWTDENGSRLELCELEYSHTRNTQHIYITSDEYIGLSYYLDGNLVRKGVVDDKDYWEVRKDYKKIILTTDQDLIKDGVQAIDDEFLDWFVKNPSCEFVEVEKVGGKYFNDGTIGVISYDIIIPKEEPKPHSFCETPKEKCTMNYCDENGCQNRKRELVEPKQELPIVNNNNYNYVIETNKQETLEEVAEIILLENTKNTEILYRGNRGMVIKSMLDIAKWQQEQIYNQIKELHDNEHITGFSKRAYAQCLDIVEQFKNK